MSQRAISWSPRRELAKKGFCFRDSGITDGYGKAELNSVEKCRSMMMFCVLMKRKQSALASLSDSNTRVVAMFLLSVMLGGCGAISPKEYTEFRPAIPDVKFEKRNFARETKLPVSKLRQQGYFEVGRVLSEQLNRQCDDISENNCRIISHEKTSKNLALEEAARRGGDVVSFSMINKIMKERRYRNGSCLKSRQERQTVYKPVYSYECRTVGNNYECESRQTGSRMETELVTVCIEYEQIPYLVEVEKSKGTVWRLDKEHAASYSKLVDYSKSPSLTSEDKSKVGGVNDADRKFLYWYIGGLLGLSLLVLVF